MARSCENDWENVAGGRMKSIGELAERFLG